MAMQGGKLRGALARAPRERAMERLSPGVYRGSQGGLVGQGGQALQRQPQQPPPQQSSPFGPAQLKPGESMGDVMQAVAGQPGQVAQQPDQYQNQFQQMQQQMQPSANNGGQYRLSPGVYGSREQALQQYSQRIAQMGFQNPMFNGMAQQFNPQWQFQKKG